MSEPNKISTDFKLLAIRPRKGCHPNFRKVLKEGQIYKFYNDYKFRLKNEENPNSEVQEINYYKTSPDNLFDLPEVRVNVSAIVGENGSGKSTVSELFFYAIYYWGIYFNQINAYYESLLDKKAEIEDQVNPSQYDKEDLNFLNQQITKEKNHHLFILKNFRVSIFYQLDGEIIELKMGYYYNENKDESEKNFQTIILGNPNRKQPIEDKNRELTNHFFYSLGLNYSQFALNDNITGNWITTLFHKNDAYQLPISINPMRTNGNFDINKELSLAKHRLLHNLLLQHKHSEEKNPKIWISDNQYVKTINFYFNPSKIEEVAPLKSKTKDPYPIGIKEQVVIDAISILSKDKIDEIQLHTTKLPFKDEIFDYIFQKVVKISRTYPNHKRKLDFGDTNSSLENKKFFTELKKDESHITFKLKQAINFLQHSLENRNKRRNPWPEDDLKNNKSASLTLMELSRWININNLKPTQIINHIPPPIFQVEIILSSIDEREESSFESLSSGEQQLIHSIQSVLYHLNNLNSVFEANDDRKQYNAVNIMYDEIELYFHPEYQRQLLDRLLTAINRLTIKSIKNINIQFSTHSPFILSDIPGSNILCLKNGTPVKNITLGKSFAANIHDLLANEFFMKESFMGEHAKKKIEQCILYLNYHKTIKDKKDLINHPNYQQKLTDGAIRNKKIELIEITKVKQERGYDQNFFNQDHHLWYKNVIDIIGEPIIKTKLLNMYEEVFGKNPREIARLKLLKLAQEFNFKINIENIE